MISRHFFNPFAGMLRLLAVTACGVLIAGCSSVNSMLGGNSEKDALKDMKWTYAEDGFQVEIQADPQLNEAGGQPHVLTLAVVQMDDPSAFEALTANAAAIRTLLLAESPPKGTLSLQRLYIAPGEKRQLQLVRVENAKYLGLVAGYDHLESARSARLYRIGVQVASSGMIVKTRTAEPEPLKISLLLGPAGIQDSPSTTAQPVDPVKPEAGLVTKPAAEASDTTPSDASGTTPTDSAQGSGGTTATPTSSGAQ